MNQQTKLRTVRVAFQQVADLLNEALEEIEELRGRLRLLEEAHAGLHAEIHRRAADGLGQRD